MSFIRNYLTYTSCNEAHENYHTWCALSAIASLLARKVWVRRPYQILYPNIYVLLVGPAGNRKTAAMELAKGLLRSVGGVPFSADATSRENLIQQMIRAESAYEWNGRVYSYCPMTIMVTELKEFLTIDPARMINFLTDIYDQDVFDYSTQKDGSKIITNACMNMLACETPEWISDRMKERIVAGGFSRRAIYVYETEHHFYHFKALPEECERAYDFLVKDGKRIANLIGQFTWTKEAEEWYDAWYGPQLRSPPDPYLRSFYDSKHTLITKIAMLISASEESALRLRTPHFRAALDFVNAIEQNMVKVYAGSGRNELGLTALKIQDMLDRAGTLVQEKAVFVALWQDCRSMQEMAMVVEHLVRTGSVKRLRDEASGRVYLCSAKHYRPSTGQQPSSRVEGSTADKPALDSPHTAPDVTPSEKSDLLQVFRRSAPSASVPPKVESPSEPDAPGKAGQSVPDP